MSKLETWFVEGSNIPREFCTFSYREIGGLGLIQFGESSVLTRLIR